MYVCMYGGMGWEFVKGKSALKEYVWWWFGGVKRYVWDIGIRFWGRVGSGGWAEGWLVAVRVEKGAWDRNGMGGGKGLFSFSNVNSLSHPSFALYSSLCLQPSFPTLLPSLHSLLPSILTLYFSHHLPTLPLYTLSTQTFHNPKVLPTWLPPYPHPLTTKPHPLPSMTTTLPHLQPAHTHSNITFCPPLLTDIPSKPQPLPKVPLTHNPILFPAEPFLSYPELTPSDTHKTHTLHSTTVQSFFTHSTTLP